MKKNQKKTKPDYQSGSNHNTCMRPKYRECAGINAAECGIDFSPNQ